MDELFFDCVKHKAQTTSHEWQSNKHKNDNKTKHIGFQV